MESFTPEQRQALQNAHQQVVQAAAQQVQQAQQELTERVAFLQSELDRARGARRTEAGMTGNPIPLNRTGSNWEEFNLKLKAFVGLGSEPLVREMERMEEPNTAELNIEPASVDISTENRNLYYDLTMLTTGTSLKLVKGVSGNNGLEAYRQLCRRWHAGTRGRNLARLQAILQWNFGVTATETLDSLASWESEIEEWEQLTGERMADSIKLCVLDAQAPKELSTYLRLHTKAEETFATVKRKIQDYLQAMDQSGPAPMEVGFVGKKGKKGKKGKQANSNSRRVAASRTTAKTSNCRTRTKPRLMKGRAMENQSKVRTPRASFRDIAGTAASGVTRSVSAGESRSTIWQTAPRPAAARGWTRTTAPTNTEQAQVKVVLLAICGSRRRSTTISGSSQWAWLDGLRDSRDVQASGARFLSIVAARRQCAARSIFRTTR